MGRVAKILTAIGAFVWLGSYLFYACLVIASERIALKTRVKYLESILIQDIAWFDMTNTSELSQRLGNECQSIQRAIGEKIGIIVMAFGMSISGLFFSFFKGWFFSAILFCYFPFMLGASFFIGMSMQRGFSANLKAYGQSAGYAEQALNAIKVVFAFGQEETEVANYVKYLARARAVGIKTHIYGALSVGIFYFTLYGYYAYSFYSGSFMITQQVENWNSGKVYTSGDVLACFLGIVYGVFSLGLAAPNFKALTEGRVAGKMAYDVIERRPRILLEEPGAKKVSQLKGHIEFRNVSFTYPSRPGQKVLDNFSAIFEQGKTTAIVGASGSGKSTII